MNFHRTELLQVYERLEYARNKQQLSEANMRRNYRSLFREDFPQFVLEHFKIMRCGLEVWMCTIGAGIVPKKRCEVLAIWDDLSASFDKVADAIDSLRAV